MQGNLTYALHAGVTALCAGLAAGMFLSLIWMVLLRFAAGLMAWAAIGSVNIFCAAFTMLAFLKVPLVPLFKDLCKPFEMDHWGLIDHES